MGKVTRREFVKKAALLGSGVWAIAPAFSYVLHAQSPGGQAAARFLAPPYLGRPTPSSVTLNVLPGDRDIFYYVQYREVGRMRWQRTEERRGPAMAPVETPLTSLKPGTLHAYRVCLRYGDEKDYACTQEQAFRTQRSGGGLFSFALFSDSHITPFHRDRFILLKDICTSILTGKPDFAFMLGDNIQTFTSHGGPMTEERFAPALYSLLRRGLGEMTASVPVFNVLGNWEGENGWHPERERGWARNGRMAFIPNPGPGTYPEGGGPDEDYYAFTWGDVLCVALSVTRYTPADHALQSPLGRADDWTLGHGQKEWLRKVLSRSTAKWKLLFIHHTVGGHAADATNSRYGRGGGRAAQVGEQALIHKWMKEQGVQALFYGHDHVFTDIPVDGIHYVCVGSAGAPWKFPESVTGYETYWTPSGYTWVDVDEHRLTVSFMKPSALHPQGDVLHRFKIAKT